MYKGYSDKLRRLKKEHKIINQSTILCTRCKKINNIQTITVIMCYFCNNPKYIY